jgi:hypothetical protein
MVPPLHGCPIWQNLSLACSVQNWTNILEAETVYFLGLLQINPTRSDGILHQHEFFTTIAKSSFAPALDLLLLGLCPMALLPWDQSELTYQRSVVTPAKRHKPMLLPWSRHQVTLPSWGLENLSLLTTLTALYFQNTGGTWPPVPTKQPGCQMY